MPHIAPATMRSTYRLTSPVWLYFEIQKPRTKPNVNKPDVAMRATVLKLGFIITVFC